MYTFLKVRKSCGTGEFSAMNYVLGASYHARLWFVFFYSIDLLNSVTDSIIKTGFKFGVKTFWYAIKNFSDYLWKRILC